MRASLRFAFATGLLGTALSGIHCGGTVEKGIVDGGPAEGGPADGAPPPKLPVPTNHRPTAPACPTTRPPGENLDSGIMGFGCTNDSQCTAGKNGRCTPSGHNAGPSCEYDTCFTDADCAKGDVCECGGPAGTGRYANTCLPGNCRVDADCGSGGYCSPSYGTSCGAYGGIVGYYCHTAKDQCDNDNQCTEGGAAGYCGYQPTTGNWTCIYSFCAG
jgi:Cys-rich repeat protein